MSAQAITERCPDSAPAETMCSQLERALRDDPVQLLVDLETAAQSAGFLALSMALEMFRAGWTEHVQQRARDRRGY